MDGCPTRERILDAAERLFAEQGFAATSMRAITCAAGVNLAAVNYHFGAKEKLLCAVVRRRVVPINCDRLERLDRLEASAGRRPVSVEALLNAVVAPVFAPHAAVSGGGHFPRLLGRLYAEPVASLAQFYEDEFDEVFRRFGAALRRAVPGLSAAGLFWGMEFVTAMLCHTLMAGDRLRVCTGAHGTSADADEITRQVVRFAAAGLRAAASGRGRGRRRVR